MEDLVEVFTVLIVILFILASICPKLVYQGLRLLLYTVPKNICKEIRENNKNRKPSEI